MPLAASSGSNAAGASTNPAMRPRRAAGSKAAGQQAVVQYEISAPDGTHEYAMRIADGRCEIDQGRAESPRVTIRIGLGDFLHLITGAANGMQLFMTGKLKVSGDLFFAQTYQSWFDRPQG